MRIHFKFTPQMRERMKAGLSFLYTTRDGHRWYIDATLNMPCRQVDFAEAMYDAFSLDGLGFFPLYPSLSICQQALEEGCESAGETVNAKWISSIEELKPKVAALQEGWQNEQKAFYANYGGNGPKPMVIY